ncbi:MAG: hypothetical protein KDC98_25770 [Planctomycetes bacterium]|nr:hypothetical protein [Planctomycetota bacterium]
MRNLLADIDRLLRGHFTRKQDLLAGRIGIPARTLVLSAFLLGAIYGVFMGIFAVLREQNPSTAQLLATIIKVPLLFLATLLVTYPSLYVFSALANSALRGMDTLRLLVASITVNLALLASFGPIIGFFTLSTSSYPFLVVLNVIFFAISGVTGVVFLRRALGHLFVAESDGAAETRSGPPASAAEAPPPLPSTSLQQRQAAENGRRVFRIWMITYALVGAQMAWILRPFIGVPEQAFTFFRQRDSNFFEGLWHALRSLFG